jgi:hypothetical protein
VRGGHVGRQRGEAAVASVTGMAAVTGGGVHPIAYAENTLFGSPKPAILAAFFVLPLIGRYMAKKVN